MDPHQEALDRTVNMVRAQYPGAQLLQTSAVASQMGASRAAAIVTFTDTGQAGERRVYADYSVNCEEPKPSCLTLRMTVWDDQDPDFLARASARVVASAQ